jgi:hypothetical protein
LLTCEHTWGEACGTQPHNLVDNANSKAYINSVKAAAMEHLRAMEHAPGVCMHEVSSLGDAESSLGDAKSSLGDAESSLGDAKSSLGGV